MEKVSGITERNYLQNEGKSVNEEERLLVLCDDGLGKRATNKVGLGEWIQEGIDKHDLTFFSFKMSTLLFFQATPYHHISLIPI